MHRLAAPSQRRAVGLVVGMVLDVVFADPRRGHPVAAFGRAAGALERRLYADDRRAGVVFTVLAVSPVIVVGWLVERAAVRGGSVRSGPVKGGSWRGVAATALATWAVLGGTSLRREGLAMAALLDITDGSDGSDGSDDTDEPLDAARDRLRNLCARDASRLDADGLARATVESLAENVSDAVVAPLLWGAVAGLPGLLGYRAVNTLDAMVGYRSPRYCHFGWASARLDDAVNLVPARVSGVLLAAGAPAVGGSTRRALRVLLRDGGDHPSPNAGRPEAAAAGALGVTLGGSNTYHGAVENRGLLGAPAPAPRVADVNRATRLITVASAAGLVVAAGLALAVDLIGHRVGLIGHRVGLIGQREYLIRRREVARG